MNISSKSVSSFRGHKNFRYALLFVSVLGYLCCPDRSDFNLPLGIFAFMMWGDQQFSHKHRIIYMLLFSLIGDLLWIIFVGFIKWNMDEHVNEAAKAMHQLTRIVSILNFLYKLGLIIYATQKIESCKNIFDSEVISQEISGSRYS